MMINPIDRTADLVKALAAHHKTAVSSDAVLCKPQSIAIRHRSKSIDGDDEQVDDRHEFTRAAVDMMAQLNDMIGYIEGIEIKYKDFSVRGMTDMDRDSIDSDIGKFVSESLSKIDELKTHAVEQVQLLFLSSWVRQSKGFLIECP